MSAVTKEDSTKRLKMANKFKQYDSVELLREMMSDGTLSSVALMRAGQKGVIVEVYSQDNDGYDVEFFDNDGNTVALMIMKEGDIRLTDA